MTPKAIALTAATYTPRRVVWYFDSLWNATRIMQQATVRRIDNSFNSVQRMFEAVAKLGQ